MNPSPTQPIQPTQATQPKRRVAVFGECMLELQGQAFGTLRQTYGGDTLNCAVYLARCARDVQVHYATALGDDRFSDEMLRRWSAEGLHTGLVRRIPGRLPGLYLIELDERGERRFHYWRDSSAARAYFDDIAVTPLEQRAAEWDALVFSGISLAILPPPARERLLLLAGRLRERGASVAFDSNFRPRLWPDAAAARAVYECAFATATLALVSLEDLQALHGLPDAAAALRQGQALASRELVLKAGAAPTRVRDASGRWHEVPTERVDSVVDSTAAGDSFAAGYLAQRLAGAAPAAAAAFGNRLAARVIQHPGALLAREAMADLMR